MSETININTYPIQETIDVTTVNDITTVNINVIQSTGAVTSVNEQIGDVVLTTNSLSNDSGYITTSSLPTNVSQLANDSKYITSADLPDVSGLVPYTGAMFDLELGEKRIVAGKLVTKKNASASEMELNGNYLTTNHTAEWQDKDYAGIADISDIPTTATDLDALKRDGSNTNSDIDLGSYSLNAKSIKINGTGGNGHLSLKHQSTGITATTSESAIGANSSGNPIWKNDGNPQQELMLKNSAITGATKTKITYDVNGLVTSGADATTADIADSSNKRYVTDAQLTIIGNISGTNTGDNATNSQYSGLAGRINQNIAISGTFTGTSPSDATTYYVGASSTFMATTETSRRWRFPYATTIRTAMLSLGQTTAGSNETVSVYLRNSTAGTETLVGTFTSDFTGGTGAHFNFSGLSIAIPNTTDYWTFKIVCPTWVTNPTGWTGSFFVIAN